MQTCSKKIQGSSCCTAMHPRNVNPPQRPRQLADSTALSVPAEFGGAAGTTVVVAPLLLFCFIPLLRIKIMPIDYDLISVAGHRPPMLLGAGHYSTMHLALN